MNTPRDMCPYENQMKENNNLLVGTLLALGCELGTELGSELGWLFGARVGFDVGGSVSGSTMGEDVGVRVLSSHSSILLAKHSSKSSPSKISSQHSCIVFGGPVIPRVLVHPPISSLKKKNRPSKHADGRLLTLGALLALGFKLTLGTGETVGRKTSLVGSDVLSVACATGGGLGAGLGGFVAPCGRSTSSSSSWGGGLGLYVGIYVGHGVGADKLPGLAPTDPPPMPLVGSDSVAASTTATYEENDASRMARSLLVSFMSCRASLFVWGFLRGED